MPLTDDEYSCLMIMAEGQNLIRMKDTRWEKSLTSLHAKGFAKPIGNENFVITETGRTACAERDSADDRALTSAAEAMIGMSNARFEYARLGKEAVDKVILASRAAALGTGDSVATALENTLREIGESARDQLKQKRLSS